MDDLLSDFLTETNESLAELDVALITLERTPDDAETLGFIFRLVHTIKGTCGFLGLPRLERVAHAGENVLGKLRDHTLTVTPDIVSQVLVGIDQIKAIVTVLSPTGAEPVGEDTELIAALNAVASNEPPVAARAAPPAVAPVSVEFKATRGPEPAAIDADRRPGRRRDARRANWTSGVASGRKYGRNTFCLDCRRRPTGGAPCQRSRPSSRPRSPPDSTARPRRSPAAGSLCSPVPV